MTALWDAAWIIFALAVLVYILPARKEPQRPEPPNWW